MSETVIKVENLSKQYRLGLVGVTTISEDIKRYWAKIQGKEDPSLKIGHTNKLNTKITTQNSKHKIPDYVWALKDINFEVKQGEVLGIIGKNGAGKSTLLKILSKVTAPSIGNIKIKGRIASLLEVGTGFHAELTGRENIFLNGAILGMTKVEIKSKLDEIIDFSGVERYIDTPVKRYSSGMYVRLAFAVAAHLEPEILILDEVLAVGDAEFQKKCLGKMGDVAKGGRTVLFVSHNIIAIEHLCKNTILLEDGQMVLKSDTQEVVTMYKNKINKNLNEIKYSFNNKYFKEIYFTKQKSTIININEEIEVTLILEHPINYYISVDLKTQNDVIVFSSRYYSERDTNKSKITFIIPNNLLNSERYSFSVYLFSSATMIDILEDVLPFTIIEQRKELYLGKINGIVRTDLKWIEE